MSKTLCPIPWMSLHVATTGDVMLCCISEPVGNIKDSSLSEIWNNDKMKNIRQQLLSDQKPSECHRCFYIEDVLNGESHRHRVTREFGEWVDPVAETNTDGTLNDMKLQYVDFRFNSLCNFKCRMCHSVYSSQIATEEYKLYKLKAPIYKDNASVLYNEMVNQYPHVKKIYFAGGEPMMQEEHFKTLHDLIDMGKAPEVTLLYSTNGSRFKNEFGDVRELWKHFKLIEASFSIDGYSTAGEYWRSGGKWDEIDSNIRSIKNIPNIQVSFHCTIGWPNILNWGEFIKYAVSTELSPHMLTHTALSSLEGPSCFSLTCIPDFKKQQIYDKMQELKEFLNQYEKNSRLANEIDVIVKKMMITKNTLNTGEFRNKVFELDKYRKENFFQAFPEHEDMLPYVIYKNE